MKQLLTALLFCAACKPSAQAAAPVDAGALDPADSRSLLAEVDRLKDQLKDKPKTFEVLSALGNLYYENGRYLEAVDAYRQAEELAAPAEAEADSLRKKGVKPAPELPAECRRSGTEYGLAQILEAAKKMDPARERRCLDSALEMALSVRAHRGNSFYLIGNPDSALIEHRQVLTITQDYPESLFFVGAILLEQGKAAEGKKHWQRLLQVAPDSPRAAIVRDTLPRADEVFKPQAQLPAGHPPLPAGHPAIAPTSHAGPTEEEIANLADAVKNTERTPQLEKGLDQLLAEGEQDLDQGKYQDARDAVVRVMPMRPDDARAAAELGGAMRGLGRLEMAERTLARALQLDPRQPRALYEMARLQAQQGDKVGAARTFAALKSADAKFAGAHKVDEELAKLK